MNKYIRGKLLAGQIIALVVFAYLTLNYFVVSYALDQVQGGETYATLAFWVAFVCIAEVVFSILGIVHSVLPYGKFKKGTALTSSIYSGVFGLILLISLFTIVTTQGAGLRAMIALALFCSMALLISGIIQAGKEGIHMRPYSPETMQPRANSFGNDDFVPLAVSSQPRSTETPITPVISPEANKTAQDLLSLKNLYEQHLITEDEYNEKRKEVLNRDFSAK